MTVPEWWRPLCRWQFILLLAIFTYFGLTTASGPHIPQYNDKLMHFLGYGVAGWSVTVALPGWPVWQRLLVLVVYSTGIEVIQHFLPPRTFSLGDILANVSGALLGIGSAELARRLAPNLSRALLER